MGDCGKERAAQGFGTAAKGEKAKYPLYTRIAILCKATRREWQNGEMEVYQTNLDEILRITVIPPINLTIPSFSDLTAHGMSWHHSPLFTFGGLAIL